MSFLRKSSLTLATRLGVVFLGFLISAWTARVLGPEGKGVYALLTLIPMLIAQFACLGLTNANIYLIGQGRTAPRPAAENTLFFAIIASLAVFGLYWLFRVWLDPLLFKNISPALRLLTACSIPFYLIFLLFNYLALAVDDFLAFNLPNLGRQILVLLGFGLLALWQETTLFHAMLLWSIVNVVIAWHSWWLIYRRDRFRPAWHPVIFRETLGYGLKTYVGVILYLLNWRLDFILCNFYLDPAAVGYYSTSAAIGEMLWFIPQTLSVVLLPQVARLSASEARQLTSRVCRLTIWLSLLAALFLAVLAKPVITIIFGAEFLPAEPALLLLLPGIVFYCVTNLLTSYVVGRGHPQENNRALALAFLTNVLANLYFIPRWGIIGAALASTLSYTLATLYLLWAYQRLSGASLHEMIWLQRNDFQFLKKLKLAADKNETPHTGD